MNNEYFVRLAEFDDLSNLAKIFDSYRAFYKQSSNIEAAFEFLKERLANKESVIFIAVSKEQDIFGFMQIYPTFSSISMRPALILNDLFVNAEHRKSGIASKLLKQAIDYAKQNNFAWLTLQTSIDNVKAQNLYKAHGFSQETEFLTFNHS